MPGLCHQNTHTKKHGFFRLNSELDVRISWQEAIDRGLVQPEDLPRARKPSAGGSSCAAEKHQKIERFICSIEGDKPQEILWRALARRQPNWVRHGLLCWEYRRAVPRRRFRLDIAYPWHGVAIESDGWNWHGRYLGDFKRDRERDRLLTLSGWRVLRFYAHETHNNLPDLIDQIEQLLAVVESQRGERPETPETCT